MASLFSLTEILLYSYVVFLRLYVFYERVVLVFPPSLNFTIAFLACLKAGLIAVPVFPPSPVRRDSIQMFAVIVQACGANVALTDTTYQYQKKLVGIRDAFQKWTKQRQHSTSATPLWPESLNWIVTNTKSSLIEASSKKRQPLSPIIADENDEKLRSQVAFLQFTSGSTSEPKGVMITHGNLAHNLHCITNELQATDDTVVVSWLPQYHDMGLIGSVLGCLYCGGTGYYMSPLTFLQRPMTWIEAVSQYKATHLQAPNFAYKLTARKFQESRSNTDQTNLDKPVLDLTSVRHAINAAEPVDVESMTAFYDLFSAYGLKRIIYPTYGLAEHTVFVCSGGKQILRVSKDELEVNGRVVLAKVTDTTEFVSTMVGCGYPSSQMIDVQIVKHENLEDGTDFATALNENLVGEIWVRSPSKAAGYYNKPQETIDDFHAILQSTDIVSQNNQVGGYLRTGDLGFLHNNELFICGRLKDLIIIGGRNYYPQDIESTAESSSDKVRLGCSAAFTIDSTKQGDEEVALVMELKDVPESKDIENICTPLANRVRSLINQEHSIGISAIAFLKPRTAPKTSSGKIARAWCRKGYVAESLDFVYQRSFKSELSSLEIEQGGNTQQLPQNLNSRIASTNDAVSIRANSKDEILKMLITDISRVGNIPADSVDKKAPMVHMLDSLTLTQFKGMLENNYSVKLSDEYLFRETTTATKLVEVVKLGYAPDDVDGDNTAGVATSTAAVPGHAKGLAGALGCPPGVVCVIM
jgi:acyl-CoA synthetase (AMP-forming)/AMP-acid ligase II